MPGLTEAQLKAKLILDPPSDLHFIGPFTRQISTKLQLTNPSDNNIIFKIKTTAPKRYCVRPNFGCVNPHETVTVEICSQPFDYYPHDTIKHKFMVQSVVWPVDGDVVDTSEYFSVWKELPPENFMDAKLKCVFEMPNKENEEEPLNASKNVVKMKASSPPKMKSEEKVYSNMDTSDKSESLNVEVENLREEKNKLKRENINLKEELLRLRSNESYTPIMAEKQIPMFYIAIAIAAVIFGILLGKFLL